jgi:hypothetical protein
MSLDSGAGRDTRQLKIFSQQRSCTDRCGITRKQASWQRAALTQPGVLGHLADELDFDTADSFFVTHELLKEIVEGLLVFAQEHRKTPGKHLHGKGLRPVGKFNRVVNAPIVVALRSGANEVPEKLAQLVPNASEYRDPFLF